MRYNAVKLEGETDMFTAVKSSLREEAINAIVIIPEDRLPVLIQFAKFLGSSSYEKENNIDTDESLSAKRKLISGRLKGKINIAEDFNDTPDCFNLIFTETHLIA